MGSQYAHLPDEDLLRFADGEFPSRRASDVKEHLDGCWECRARLRQMEATITDFLHVHHRVLDAQLPPAAGPRALLKAHIMEVEGVGRSPWFRQIQHAFGGRWSYAAAVILVVVLGSTFAHRFPLSKKQSPDSAAFRLAVSVVPDPHLTPGAVRPVTMTQVCEAHYSDDPSRLPVSVRQAVFSEYGISGMQSAGKDYELDYLISPQLGGSDDIRNLWPEPSTPVGWNLRMKDALENRLHQLVCDGKLNLSTAQSDLATDWISAYKKYFHTTG
jgi:hypothetical protein